MYHTSEFRSVNFLPTKGMQEAKEVIFQYLTSMDNWFHKANMLNFQDRPLITALKFDTNLHGMCNKANHKIHVFGRLRPYLGKDKSKLLVSAAVLSNFP